MSFSTDNAAPPKYSTRETQIPRYKFKLHSNLKLNLTSNLIRLKSMFDSQLFVFKVETIQVQICLKIRLEPVQDEFWRNFFEKSTLIAKACV